MSAAPPAAILAVAVEDAVRAVFVSAEIAAGSVGLPALSLSLSLSSRNIFAFSAANFLGSIDLTSLCGRGMGSFVDWIGLYESGFLGSVLDDDLLDEDRNIFLSTLGSVGCVTAGRAGRWDGGAGKAFVLVEADGGGEPADACRAREGGGGDMDVRIGPIAVTAPVSLLVAVVEVPLGGAGGTAGARSGGGSGASSCIPMGE